MGVRTIFLGLLLCGFALQTGCNPTNYRTDTDKIAGNIITEKQVQGTGKASKFSIERPSDVLRRRLLANQNLPTSSPASLGTDRLKKIEHWPEKNYPAAISEGNIDNINDVNKPITITLMQALQIGALNSFDYQTQKENVFQSALSLELERHSFRNTFVAQVQNLLSTDTTGDRAVSGTVTSGEIGASRKFQSGAEISTSIAIDLANLLTMGGASSTGLAGEGSIAIPLLRGSGRHIVAEPLTQAERDTIYAIWNFERYKKLFAVDIASKYLSVLQQLDKIKNSEADYRSRISSAKRSRRLADAGRIQEIEVDQAVQNELTSRQKWIAATQSYKRQLDSFKTFLGLPPDALIELDPNELKNLAASMQQLIDLNAGENETIDVNQVTSDSDLLKLLEADYKNAGPYEIEESLATKLAFENRYDLKTADGQVYDAQRAVVVAADALGAELTFLGSANIGSRRDKIGDATSDNSRFVANRGVFYTLLTIDLPLDRKRKSLEYRNSFIKLEQAVRTMQAAEDTIKTEIRNTLRDLLEARENMYIQAKAVSVAEKRVKSVNMFLEAGRAQIRDLLEAQDALLDAQNALTAAVVSYRVAELAIQRDTGVLEVDEKGLWKEYSPGGI
ncbi:MAG: TolC family protein [Planctomycetes bacterium HGW-Planctomycetes-1]|nr:MAG: TolC family protein [Planctomycetes bacterium HGW-Planctomycetes-1]